MHYSRDLVTIIRRIHIFILQQMQRNDCATAMTRRMRYRVVPVDYLTLCSSEAASLGMRYNLGLVCYTKIGKRQQHIDSKINKPIGFSTTTYWLYFVASHSSVVVVDTRVYHPVRLLLLGDWSGMVPPGLFIAFKKPICCLQTRSSSESLSSEPPHSLLSAQSKQYLSVP